jgi:hypothetical protein
MRRNITIASSLAVLCLVAVVVWVSVKRAAQDIATAPKGNSTNTDASNKSSGPTQKTPIPPSVFGLPVQIAFFGDNQFSPCYVDLDKMTLYRWRGVVLRRDEVPNTGAKMGILVLDAKDFSVVAFEAPVKYLESEGLYHPGYLDRSGRAFYEWKGVVLNKPQVLDKSQEGQPAVADPDAFSQVLQIEMPAHLKEQPGLWKKA